MRTLKKQLRQNLVLFIFSSLLSAIPAMAAQTDIEAQESFAKARSKSQMKGQDHPRFTARHTAAQTGSDFLLRAGITPDANAVDESAEVSAFTRLANQNLGEVDPEWVVYMCYSHPPLGERIAKAQNWKTG